MDEIPQKELVTRIALEDLQRRRQEIAPQVDANIEEVLKICEQRLAEAGELPKRDDAHWDAEFNFWHRIISEEVERLRFNEGYEPISIDLYPTPGSNAAFLGKTQVGHVQFRVSAYWRLDQNDVKILRIQIRKA